MSRSYKKPFVKMAKDVEFQKMANREFRRKAKNVLRGSADPERHMPEKNRKEGDCWGWPSEGVNCLFPTRRALGNSENRSKKPNDLHLLCRIKKESIMLSFKEHAKKFNLDEEEQEILADFEANHAGKPQITEERRKELASLANASWMEGIMLNTMQRLSADAARAGASEMSLDEINAEIDAARNGR